MTDSISLGPFELLAPLGRTSQAEVWQGVHVQQRLPVAVRVMAGEAAQHPDYRSAFRNEVRSAAVLEHPSVLMVLDYGMTPATNQDPRLPAGAPYMVMELASGGTLAAAVTEALPWVDLRGVLLAVLDALSHAHARGVVHRDLRPRVVRICTSDDLRPGLKLSDFGLAHAANWHLHAGEGDLADQVRPHWAPEQVEGRWRDQGPWTDLYAMGCLAWQLSTGVSVFQGFEGQALSAAILAGEIPGFRPRKAVPSGYEGWLRRLLSRHPRLRYRCAADAAWGLRQLGQARGGLREQAGRTLSDLDGTDLGVELHTIHSDLVHGSSARRGGDVPPVPDSWGHGSPALPPLQLVGAGLSLYWLRTFSLVDREVERDAIWAALRQVDRSGRARLVLLRGPAGTGRSRIVEWMCERAQELGAATVLRMSHGPRSDPRDALGRMVSQHLRCGRLGREEVAVRVATWLLDRGEDDPYEADALTEVLAPTTRREAGVSTGRRISFSTTSEPHAVVRRFLEHLSRERPVIVWMDDVQWGANALEFAAHMLRAQAMSPSRVLVVATVRDEALAERPDERARLEALLEQPAVHSLDVGPLPVHEQEKLVHNLLRLEGDLAAQVVERTAGNPLFAVQLVGDWVLRGVLEVGATGFRVKEGAGVDLPDDLHEVWAGRLDQLLAALPDEAGTFVELAAVLGLEVDDDEWQEVTDDPTGFLRRDLSGGRFGFSPAHMRIRADLVEALLEARLAVETEVGWAFAHPMLRESLERRAREGGRLASHHQACAAMLQRRREDGQLSTAERIGRHLMAAGALEQAVEPLVEGARDRMLTTGAREARALLTTARQVMRMLQLHEGDPRWAELAIAWSHLEGFQGRYELALEWGERAVAVARGLRGDARLSRALEVLADATLHLGRHEAARALVEEAQQLYQAASDPCGVARCLVAQARTWADLERRQSLLEGAHHLFDHEGRLDSAADTLQNLAQVAIQRADFEVAVGLLDRAGALAEAHGFRLLQAEVANGRAEVARLTGDLERAQAGYAAALAIYESTGSVLATVPRLNLALVSLEQGRGRKAREVIAPVLGHLERHPQRPFLEFATVVMLAASAATEDWSEWDRCIDALEPLLVDSVHVDRDLAHTAELAGHLAHRAGEGARAARAYAVSATQWDAVGDHERAQRMRVAAAT